MKKKPLNSIDLWKIAKAKRVNVVVRYNTGNVNSVAQRFYFENDGQLDDKIIIGIQSHAQYVDGASYGDIIGVYNNGGDTIRNVGVTRPTTTGNAVSSFFISLCDLENNYFWFQQSVSSLCVFNTGKYIKRLYNRIKLDKCFIENYIAANTHVSPNNYWVVPFTFYYIDQQ